MKNLIALLFLLVFVTSCSSEDSKDDIIEQPVSNDLTEVEKVNILNKKIDKLKVSLNFGVQANELEQNLLKAGYDNTSITKCDDFSCQEHRLFISPEPIYGLYHKRYGIEKGYGILFYFQIIEPTIIDVVKEPLIAQEYFYENNPEAQSSNPNKPFFLVQISFEEVNSNTYKSVKNWVLSLDKVTGSFKEVSDLKYVKERITQSDMIVEIGEYESIPGKIIFARFFENRTPIYAQ